MPPKMNIHFSNSNSKPNLSIPIRSSSLGLKIPMISRISTSKSGGGCNSCGNIK